MSVPVEVVSLRTSDGVTLTADVYRPEAAPRGGVVIAHGLSASRRHPAVVAQADALVRRGLLVLAYDGRGHGTSSGDCTLGRSEVHDVEAAVAYLSPHVPSVVAVGASMGAIAVLEYAPGHPQLAGIVLVSTATSWRSVLTLRAAAATALTRTRAGRMVARRTTGVRISPAWQAGERTTAQVARVQVPVAIIHGRADRLVRPSAAFELYKAAPEPRRLDLVDGMGHSFEPAGIAAVNRAVDWALEQSLAGPVP
jgi:pimeloyl-ACP methyl ester carboxylesterase